LPGATEEKHENLSHYSQSLGLEGHEILEILPRYSPKFMHIALNTFLSIWHKTRVVFCDEFQILI
jgi:hypothetical protein